MTVTHPQRTLTLSALPHTSASSVSACLLAVTAILWLLILTASAMGKMSARSVCHLCESFIKHCGFFIFRIVSASQGSPLVVTVIHFHQTHCLPVQVTRSAKSANVSLKDAIVIPLLTTLMNYVLETFNVHNASAFPGDVSVTQIQETPTPSALLALNVITVNVSNPAVTAIQTLTIQMSYVLQIKSVTTVNV